MTGRPDRQAGEVSLERTEMTGLPGHDSSVRRAVANVAKAGSWNRRTARAGQPGQDRWTGQNVLDRTSRTGQWGLEHRTARKQCLENVSFAKMFLKTKIFIYVFAKILDFRKKVCENENFVNSLGKIFGIPILSRKFWTFAEIFAKFH